MKNRIIKTGLETSIFLLKEIGQHNLRQIFHEQCLPCLCLITFNMMGYKVVLNTHKQPFILKNNQYNLYDMSLLSFYRKMDLPSPDKYLATTDLKCLKEAFTLFDKDRDGEISTQE